MADVDVYTKKPRAPRVLYTELTDTQIRNIKQDPHPFFNVSKIGWQPSRTPYKNGERAITDRFVNGTNEHLFRGRTMSGPYCWIDEQITRDIPLSHNTSRHGSSLKWGPEKQGYRTYGHPEEDESYKFLRIGMYERHSTNMPRNIIMKYGRPGGDYYSQRFPQSTTWFNSSVPLNQTEILVDSHMKTKAEHDAIRTFKQNHIRQRTAKNVWPEFSEYTDKFALSSKTMPLPTTFEERKKRMLEARAAESLSS